MDRSVPLIIKDKKNNLWEFRLSEDGDLLHSITSEGGTSTEQVRINNEVLDFSVDIDRDGALHVVYVNKSGELGYCRREDSRWSSEIIHQFRTNVDGIRELALFINDKGINMTYIFQRRGNENKGILCCSQWSGGKYTTHTIGEVKLLPDVRAHYQIEVRGQQYFSLFFINNTGQEAEFKSCKYQNDVFGPLDLLFVLRGKCIDFFMARCCREIHFLGLMADSSGFTLKDVCLSQDGTVNSIANIFRSNTNISGPSLILSENIPWTFWMAEGKIFYSSFNGQWAKAGEVKAEPETQINMYYCIERSDNIDKRTQRIFGAGGPGIKLLLPPRARENAQETGKGPSLKKGNTFREATPAPKSPGGRDAQGKYHSQTADKGVNHMSRENFDRSYLKARFPQMGQPGGWDRELARKQLIIAQEKARLEGQCAELENTNIALRSEINSLKKRADARQEQMVDLESSKDKVKEQEKTDPIIEDASIISDIEERYGSLLQDQPGLKPEMTRLINQLVEEQIRARSLERQKDEIIKGLKDELEQEKNKGIFKRLLEILG